MPDYLTPDELIDRLRGVVSQSTLKRWRLLDPPQGPGFIRATEGPRGHVLYPLTEVERFEAARLRRGLTAKRRGR